MVRGQMQLSRSLFFPENHNLCVKDVVDNFLSDVQTGIWLAAGDTIENLDENLRNIVKNCFVGLFYLILSVTSRRPGPPSPPCHTLTQIPEYPLLPCHRDISPYLQLLLAEEDLVRTGPRGYVATTYFY